MLIAKGYTVSFKLVEGGTVKAPASYALLHDPEGKEFPKCAGFTSPFVKQGRAVNNREAKSYFEKFGDTRSLPIGGQLGIDVPNPLSKWKRIGEIEKINYTRKCPGRSCSHPGRYYHPFEQGKFPVLYRWGRHLRMEMGRGCEWNWRGVVYP